MKKLMLVFVSVSLMGGPIATFAEINENTETQEQVEAQLENHFIDKEEQVDKNEQEKIKQIEKNSETEQPKTEKIFFNDEWIEIEIEPKEITGLENYKTPDIDESNQNVLGSFNSKAKSRSFSNSTRAFESNNKDLPRIDFVDVSSHQGDISVNDYLNMKKQGVTGVVVKLTESTNYINPNAYNQINNARTAGLKVSVYHYSWFTNKDSAVAEARFFAKTAENMGLDRNTVMVNDAEQYQINNGRTTENSIYFASTLANEFGYQRAVHYSMASWFTPGILDMSRLGGETAAWKAEFPFSPSKNNLLHQQTAAWQWGSETHFVGDSQSSRIFDTNVDYTNTFSDALKYDIYPEQRKTFIINDNGKIYNEPYVSGTITLDTTQGMFHQLIDVTAKSQTEYGLWYEFSYEQKGVKKIGWIKSTDVSDVVNDQPKEKNMFTWHNFGTIYDSPYTINSKKIGDTNNIEKNEFAISREALTGYGLWYYGTYTQNGVLKSGWINSLDLKSEIVIKKPYRNKMFIMNDQGAIYDSPYIEDTKLLDFTTGMYQQIIDITSQSETSFGLWYEFPYQKNGVKKVGWIKSTDVKDVIDETESKKELFFAHDFGAIYDSPYTVDSLKIDISSQLKNEKFLVSKEAKTGYGLWYYGKYTKDKVTSEGWINSLDLKSEKVITRPYKNKTFVMNDQGAIYDSPYTAETKLLDFTTGMKRQVIDITAESETSFGLWYEFSYQKNGIKKVGWIKSTDVKDVIDERIKEYRSYVRYDQGVIYDSPYTANSKSIGTTANIKNKEFNVSKEARTGYGLWYYGSYEQNKVKKSGWVNALDIEVEKISIIPLKNKMFIINDQGAIYDSPYVEGTKLLDFTTGMHKDIIDITAKASTSYGLWYEFSYQKNGVRRTGWIKSTDVKDIIDEQNIQKTMLVNYEKGVVYDSPYTSDSERIGTIEGIKNKEFKVTKQARTGYGLWVYGNYEQNKEKKSGWVNALDLQEELGTIIRIEDKTFIMNDQGVIYDSPYTDGTKRLDYTTGMYRNSIDITAQSKTRYGLWYEFSYEKSSIKKTGWIKSTDVKGVIDEQVQNVMLYTINEKGVVYDSPYTANTEVLGHADNFKKKEFFSTKSARTPFGYWYYGTYEQNKEKKSGWIKSSDLRH